MNFHRHASQSQSSEDVAGSYDDRFGHLPESIATAVDLEIAGMGELEFELRKQPLEKKTLLHRISSRKYSRSWLCKPGCRLYVKG